MIEDCVRLSVIRSAIEFQLRETEHRLISFKNNKYLPISNHVNQTSQKKDNFLIRYLVPDTNLWIEKMNDIKKIINLAKSKYQLELVVSTMVFSELEGLKSSKKEKTSQNAEDATQFIIQNNIRFLTTSGKLLAGGKQYSSQSEDRKKNDEVIMESAKKLIGGVLLTEDKNLLLQAKISQTPNESLKNFRLWIEKEK